MARVLDHRLLFRSLVGSCSLLLSELRWSSAHPCPWMPTHEACVSHGGLQCLSPSFALKLVALAVVSVLPSPTPLKLSDFPSEKIANCKLNLLLIQRREEMKCLKFEMLKVEII